MQAPRNRGNHTILLSPDDGGGSGDRRKSRRERGRSIAESPAMCAAARVATFGSVKRPQVEIDRAVRALRIAVAADNVGAKHSREDRRGEEARDRRECARARVETDGQRSSPTLLTRERCDTRAANCVAINCATPPPIP